MMTRNADYLDQHTFAHLMKPWIHNSKVLFFLLLNQFFILFILLIE
jgi:hypothetical protein